VKFVGTSQNGDDARSKVADLQRQIEAKETELLRMKETLARNDSTDISAAQVELNRLQSAFDQVSKIADSKLQPVIARFQQAQSRYESRTFRMKMFHQAAKERDLSLKSMQQRVDAITADLDTPPVMENDSLDLQQLLRDNQQLQNDYQSLHRHRQFGCYTQRTFEHINDALQRQLSDAANLEQRATRKLDSVRQETELRVTRPQQVIDDDWVLTRHTMDKLRIMLEDAKRSVKFLNETAEQLANSNRRVSEELAATNEELGRLRKYLPGAPHEDPAKKTEGVARADYATLEIQRDYGEIFLGSARTKTQALKSSLDTIRSKISEMQDVANEKERELEQAKIERENAEKAVEKAVELRAELLARKLFAEQEEGLLVQRTEQQMELLRQIKTATDEAKEQLHRQKMMMRLNEEMQNLRTMNFDRFTSTITNLVDIRNRMQ
jgi:chromosome segregation ATPase